MHYICVALTLVLTVYGQLIFKWQLSDQTLPDGSAAKFVFLFGKIVNPWIFSGFASAFLASLSWMAAMTKLKLSEAYPFMSLAFILVMLLSWPLFGESLSPRKLIGTVVVVSGLIIVSR
jgi:drug/metabolite transporter (DMT)-like permease